MRSALSRCSVSARLEGRAPRLDRRVDLGARLLHARDRLGTLARDELARGLQQLGDAALLAQPAHARVFKRREVAAGGDLGERLAGKGRQV